MRTWAADIGGTSIKLAVLDGPAILARGRVVVTDRSRLEPALVEMHRAWRSLEMGLPPAEETAIALAFAGVVDAPTRRIVCVNGKFEDAPSLDLARWALDLTGRPLHIENDARAACLGEWRHGAGRGCHNLVMITLGTGVGTSAVIDGRVLRGVHGLAGILGGHIPIDFDGPTCTCGNVGCVEAVASTDRLRDMMQREITRTPALRGSSLLTSEAPSFELVASAAESGDTLALRLREVAWAAWGAGAVALIHAYDPERLILGGAIGRNWPDVQRNIREHVNRHAWTSWGRVEVRLAELGDDAALLGCAAMSAARD